MFSKAELALIKNTFADNDALLYSIRKVLLQFPLSAAERELVKQSITPAVFAVIKKRLLPDLDPDAPITQLGDYRSLLTQDLKTKSTEELTVFFEARNLEMAYLQQQLDILADIDQPIKSPGIQLSELKAMGGKDGYGKHVDLMAYLNLLGYIDPQLYHLKLIAGEKNETPEAQRLRLTRDSTK